MKEPEEKSTTLKDAILKKLTKEPILVPDKGVNIQPLSGGFIEPFTQLYRRAYERGDFFGGKYSDPEAQIFNPEWVKRDIDNPDHSWIIFTGEERTLFGSTGLFHSADSVNIENIDETQIDPAGRGRAIMPHYFRRIVPILEELGVRVTTEFLLTPGSKSLRRTLQGELGMTALGIHPHILRHRETGLTSSEISSAKFVTLEPQVVTIMPELGPVFRIVQEQLSLSDPEAIVPDSLGSPTRFTQRYEEIVVSAANLAQQRSALISGYQAVAFDPKANIFKMATFPAERPDLDFILGNEAIEPNKRLVEYLYANLYRRGEQYAQ
jgi:hypothetical protein